jgi:hypothetical protein
MKQQTKQNKEKFLFAYLNNLGDITATCKAVGINRWTYYKWLQKDEQFKKDIKEQDEVNLDFAESCLKERMKAGDTRAIIFYLESKGKSRGYGKNIDITSNGKDIEPRTIILKRINSREELEKDQQNQQY